MTYTNSSLVDVKILSQNHSGVRTHKIDRISPHCVVGQCSAEVLGAWLRPSSTQASCNYGIDKDGRVLLCVEEGNRSWCTSSKENDQRAVTIECASDTTRPYAFNDVVYNKLITLCVDICKRNGLNKLIWISDKAKALAYEPKEGECLLTIHRWFANKDCPGDWLVERLGDVAAKVTAELNKKEEPEVDEIISKDKYTVYRTYDALPKSFQPAVKKLMDKGLLKGTGETVNGKTCIDLSYDLARTLVILDRAKAFD